MRQALTDARKKNRFTQESIAEVLGISRSYYGLIEGGKRNPNYGLAVKISKILRVRINSIFFDLDGFKMKLKTTKKGGDKNER